MANVSWFANSGSMQIYPFSTTASACTVAALKGVTITPKFEIATLYGMESLFPQARCKHSFTVDVKVDYAMWDPAADTVLSSFMAGYYSTTGAGVIDTDTHRNVCATFDITATVYDTSRASKCTIKAFSVTFPEVPFEMRENEYISRALTGEGKNITITYSAA